ncbi:MAG TPA: gamma-glutamyltransferase [Tepidisphaeraceae bacterium]|nr:gamma-glutamyltransferase [Tepidisphaeraceae bacterium]
MSNSSIASRFAVATPHPQAARAARAVLEAGGNATDAAIAAMLTLCVVMPGSVGIGGYGGSMVVYSANTRRVSAIDFDSRAPLAYRDELYTDPAARETGYLSVTVPAMVAGLDLARREFGALSWPELSRHAIELAQHGFPMDAELKRHADYFAAKADPVSLRAQFPAGAVPAVGELFAQRDLARLLQRLADEGPDSFYRGRGDLPRRVVEQVRAHGGILSEDDFARYQAALIEPTSINYRGYDIFTAPPPSGGITSLAILKTLEQFDIRSLDPCGASYFHLFAEAAKRCLHERFRYLGDPDFVPIPIDELLSAHNASAKADDIRKGELARGGEIPGSGPHTANVCVADGPGNVVSLTATQGYQFGAMVCIDGLGLVLNHGMSRFDFAPGHPNGPAPAKRMLHNMAPTLILQDGKPLAAIGLPGGTKIVTVTAQLVAHFIDFRMTPEESVNFPRVHTEGDEPLAVSSKVPQAVVDALESMGHAVRRGQDVGGPKPEIAGQANAIVINPTACALSAASGHGPDAVTVG